MASAFPLEKCSKRSGKKLETSYDLASEDPKHHFYYILSVSPDLRREELDSIFQWEEEQRICDHL